jgi:hypothetical protein
VYHSESGAITLQALSEQPFRETERHQVLSMLDAALRSPSFHNAPRASRFLRFIVERKIAGEGEQLKERTIGVEVFERPPDYSTGEDSVVRVQAIDVRRRLERFNGTPEAKSLPVEVSLPSGTYSPNFTFRSEPVKAVEEQEPFELENSVLAVGTLPPQDLATQVFAPSTQSRVPLRVPLYGLLMLVVVCLAFAWGRFTQHRLPSNSPASLFWAPLSSVGRPILIFVPRTASYRLTEAWFDRYEQAHPGQFHQEWERLTRWPALSPDESLKANDLQSMLDHGVGEGDTYTATAIAAGLARLGYPFQVRLGQDYQFEDLRTSPSVLIGAFNNRWTMQVGASLPIHFEQVGKHFGLVETDGQKRTWTMQPLDSTGRWVDYGLIARLPRSASGQPTLILGGAGRPATEVLGDFVTDEARLQNAISLLPKGWENKNVIFVVKAESTDRIAGPPQVVATRVW